MFSLSLPLKNQTKHKKQTEIKNTNTHKKIEKPKHTNKRPIKQKRIHIKLYGQKCLQSYHWGFLFCFAFFVVVVLMCVSVFVCLCMHVCVGHLLLNMRPTLNFDESILWDSIEGDYFSFSCKYLLQTASWLGWECMSISRVQYWKPFWLESGKGLCILPQSLWVIWISALLCPEDTIEVIHHLWLLQSDFFYRLQDVAFSKYIHLRSFIKTNCFPTLSLSPIIHPILLRLAMICWA